VFSFIAAEVIIRSLNSAPETHPSGNTASAVDLTISIANDNNRDLLDRCLASIKETTLRTSYEIIVVDNFSKDGSLEMLSSKHPDVKVIANRRRMGFSSNHNQALRVMNGKAALILNDDTEMRPGCIDAMFSFLNAAPETGILGCRVLNADGSLQQSCYRMPSLSVLFFDAFFISSLLPGFRLTGGFKKWPHDSTREVPFMIGACLMLPKKALDAIGLLDERFVIYAEDADLCKRVTDAGFKAVFIHSAEMVHHGGATMKRVSDFSFRHFYRSMDLFFEKHYGAWALPLVAALNIAGALNRIAAWGALSLFSTSARKKLAPKISYFGKVLKYYFFQRKTAPEQ